MNGLIRTGYQLQFEEVSAANPALGRVGILPWDTDTFGFPAATYLIESPELDAASTAVLSESFQAWTRGQSVAVCSCSVPAGNRFWKRYLPTLEFQYVDAGLQASLRGLQTAALPQARTELRRADPGDWEQIEQIASTAFQHGRYHADPLFPRHLADLRYRDWMRRALSGEHSFDQVFVMGEPGAVAGFYHVTLEGSVSDLRLAAVAPEHQGSLLGFELYVGILHVLKQAGVRRVITSMSPSNTGVMNVYAALGFRFSEPEAIYHWHAGGSITE